MSFVAACAAEGYATCVMEGYDPRRVREALGVPDRFGVPMMVAVGVEGDGEEERGRRTPRLGVEETVMWGRFGEVGSVEDMYRPEGGVEE
jgi:nitroreductase